MVTIYKIWSEKGDKVYIGSTTDLKERWRHHRDRVKTNSRILFDEYGKENCKIEAIEEVKEEQLNERERYWIEFYGDKVVNKQLPGRTYSEYYYQKRKVDLSEKVTCECGKIIQRGSLYLHRTRKKHLSLLSHEAQDEEKED